jgi:hypothetical protein
LRHVLEIHAEMFPGEIGDVLPFSASASLSKGREQGHDHLILIT